MYMYIAYLYRIYIAYHPYVYIHRYGYRCIHLYSYISVVVAQLHRHLPLRHHINNHTQGLRVGRALLEARDALAGLPC